MTKEQETRLMDKLYWSLKYAVAIINIAQSGEYNNAPVSKEVSD
jgi:hypothetical protein